VTVRRGRRHKQLLDDLMETTEFLKLKEVTFDPLCGELALEEAMDLCYQRLRCDSMNTKREIFISPRKSVFKKPGFSNSNKIKNQ